GPPTLLPSRLPAVVASCRLLRVRAARLTGGSAMALLAPIGRSGTSPACKRDANTRARTTREAHAAPLTTSPSLVEPHVLAAIAGIDRIDHQGHSLDVRLPAGAAAGIEDDRTRDVLGQLALDRPGHFVAAALVGFHRQLVDQSIDLGVAIAVPVQGPATAVEDVEDQ